MDDENLLLKGANAEQWRFRVWASACKKTTRIDAAAGVKYVIGVDELEAADLDQAHDALLAETKSALEAGDPVGAVVWGYFIDRHGATLTPEAAVVIGAACICYPLLEWDDFDDREVALALLELRLKTPRDTPAEERAQQEQALRRQVGLKQIQTASQAMLDQGAPAVVIQGYLTGGIGLLRGESWQEHFRNYMGAFQKSLLRALNGCEDERAVVADNLEVLLAELLPSNGGAES